jgi:tetratricopeptide (TPR) repeat protein
MNRVSRTPADPRRLNDESWKIGVRSDASDPDYLLALREAQEAVRLVPDNFNYMKTLGAAQYRVKKYAEAIASLARSNEYHSTLKDAGGPQPADLAFLAMAEHALGHGAAAEKFLRQLTDVIKQEKWESNAEAKALFEETKRTLAKKL